MLELETYVIATKAVTLLAGGFVTLLAYRAYARTGSPALRALAAGLGLITLGGLVAGAAHQLVDFPLIAGVGIQSTFTALGFSVLAYSLYAKGGTTGGRPDGAVGRSDESTGQ